VHGLGGGGGRGEGDQESGEEEGSNLRLIDFCITQL